MSAEKYKKIPIALRLKSLSAVHLQNKYLNMLLSGFLGYIISRAVMFGSVAPFGVALAAALSPPYSICAALGGMLNCLLSPTVAGSVKYFAATLLLTGIKWIFATRRGENLEVIENVVFSIFALGVAGITIIVISDSAVYDVLLMLSEISICSGATYFFSRSVRALKPGWLDISKSDFSCIIISLAILLIGFAPINFFGVSLGGVISAVIILLCAGAARESGGAVCGITAGIAIGISSGDFSHFVAAYGLGGLIAGIFSSLGRLYTAGAFILVDLVITLLTGDASALYHEILELFIAAAIFMVIPQKFIQKMRISRIDKSLETEISAQGALRGRVMEMAGALSEIGTTTREIGLCLGKKESGNVRRVYNQVAGKVCRACPLRPLCWQELYPQTIAAMRECTAILRNDGVLSKLNLPAHLASRCNKIDDLINEINTQFANFVTRENVERRVSKVREVLTEQLSGMSMMLEEISDELCSVTLLDIIQTRKVREYFEKSGFNIQRLRCYTDSFGRISVEATFSPYQAAKLDAPKTSADLSDLLETDFDLPFTRESASTTLIFSEKTIFSTVVGAFQIMPRNNSYCGDAYENIVGRLGKSHFIVSDGMGNGGEAAVDSNMTSHLIAKLISAGFSHESALKMVNSSLLIKSGEESLATADICSVNLYSGRADFYKAGAAPSFLVRSNNVEIISSSSLPIGILQSVSFDLHSEILKNSDLLILVSDGVTATGTKWILSALADHSLSSLPPAGIAKRLAEMAESRRIDGHEDDITVLAIAITKNI